MTTPFYGLLLYLLCLVRCFYLKLCSLQWKKKNQRILESDRVCRENEIFTQYLALLRKWDFMLAKLCAWLELLLTVMGFGAPPAAEPPSCGAGIPWNRGRGS